MGDDEVVVVDQVVEEIDMQPAEEDDVDTPMREDEPSTVEMTAQESIKEAETPNHEKSTSWPPEPTDVPPVPSLLPSALSVPQETRHEEGKIHDGEIPRGGETASVVAEPAGDTERQTTSGEGKLGLAQGKTEDDDGDATSEVVEPALSVRASEVGTAHGSGTTGPPSAAPSIAGQEGETSSSAIGEQPKKRGEGETTHWPPAPTDVPAVPSLSPSALAVPELTEGEGAREARGSVVADAGSVKGETGVVEPIGEKSRAEVGSLEEGKQLEGGKQGEESNQAAVPIIIGASASDAETVPIILVINATHHVTLFRPLPSATRYHATDANGESRDLTDSVAGPLLKGMEVDVYRAPLSEVFQALRDALVERDPEFSVKRGKELVLDIRELQLSIGEVSP